MIDCVSPDDDVMTAWAQHFACDGGIQNYHTAVDGIEFDELAADGQIVGNLSCFRHGHCAASEHGGPPPALVNCA